MYPVVGVLGYARTGLSVDCGGGPVVKLPKENEWRLRQRERGKTREERREKKSRRLWLLGIPFMLFADQNKFVGSLFFRFFFFRAVWHQWHKSAKTKLALKLRNRSDNVTYGIVAFQCNSRIEFVSFWSNFSSNIRWSMRQLRGILREDSNYLRKWNVTTRLKTFYDIRTCLLIRTFPLLVRIRRPG